MINLGVGPAIGIYDSGGAGRAPFDGLFVSVTIAGSPTRDRRLYSLAPLQFQWAINFSDGGYYALLFPFGVQYEVPLVRSLYMTARFSIGYAVVFPECLRCGALSFGFVLPEFGFKYVIRKRGNLGFDPLSFPIAFGSDDNNVRVVPVYYRVQLYGGFNF
jgi:hypothetical protein